MSTISIDVDVDDVLNGLDDDDLVEELHCRGYQCSKSLLNDKDWFTKEEIDLLIAHIDIRERPLDWEWQRIRDKLIVMDYAN